MSAVYPDLEGASVFVTGGGSGIGAAFVGGFAAQGAQVAYADLKPSDHPALGIACDVSDISSLRAAMDQAAAAHGPITILINNAANDMRFDPLGVTEADWDASQAVNLKHVFFACQHMAKGLAEAGRPGAIINLSSIAYMMPVGAMTPYTTAKAAIVGMTRSLALELGPRNIRVNALAPGMVLTERQLRDWISEDDIAAMQDRQALKIRLAPEDMVGPALFLASSASGAVTGQCLPVDGGVAVTG